MGVKIKNNAFGILLISINTSATSITLQTGQGANFPSLSAGDYFYATLIDTSNNLEIVKVTARTGDVLTIVRAQEGTTARSYAVGDRIELRLTAQNILDMLADGSLSGTGTIPFAALSATPVNKAGDTMTGALTLTAENNKISQSTNHLILHDNAEADTGSNWWYIYRTGGDGKLRFYRNGADRFALNGNGTWAKAPTGTTLQVVEARSTATMMTTSTSYVDTGLSASITPSSSSSKILVMVFGGQSEWGGGGTIEWYSVLLRNGTQLGGTIARKIYPSGTGGMNDTVSYLDSPATTSALTYKTQFKAVQGTVYYNYVGTVSMVLIEIAG